MSTAELRAAVQASLRARWPNVEVGGLAALAGGRSGVTLRADVSGAGTLTSIVVKAAPFGRSPVGRHDVLRQARIISSLESATGVTVPSILASGTEPVHFCVMTTASGEAVEPVLDAADVQLDAELVRRRAIAAAQMLAALHRVADIPPPPDAAAEPVADLESELRRWRATGDAADPSILADGGRLADLLEKHLPAGAGQPALIHGDYRLGNIVFDGPRPMGLIDWEIWGVADPGIDLGWFLVFCDADLFPGIGAPVVGLPTGDDLLHCYREASGRAIDDLPWYEAFGRFKMAAIMAHNLRRHREGRHVDPFQEKLPPTIARLVETGIGKLEG